MRFRVGQDESVSVQATPRLSDFIVAWEQSQQPPLSRTPPPPPPPAGKTV
jgi:hypothetical protein